MVLPADEDICMATSLQTTFNQEMASQTCVQRDDGNDTVATTLIHMTLQTHSLLGIAGPGKVGVKHSAAATSRELPSKPEDLKSIAQSAPKELYMNRDKPWTNWVAIVVAMVVTADEHGCLMWKQVSIPS